MTPANAMTWPLADISRCATCVHAFACGIDGDGVRRYECQPCVQSHPAAVVEQRIVVTVRERDWIVAQHTATRDLFLARWHHSAVSSVWENVDRLVDHITIYPQLVDIRWRPIAALPADSRWGGTWASAHPPVRYRPARPPLEHVFPHQRGEGR